MAAFFSDLMDDFLSPVFLGRVCKKFHYETAQLPELRAVAEEMLPMMRREAFWESAEFVWEQARHGARPGAAYETVVMSLGAGLDDLQDKYSQNGLLTKSYMLEVLAGELLMQGYAAYNHHVELQTDYHVARYHFLGSEGAFPLEMLPQLLAEFAQQVRCNEAFCMIPKKSVAFVAELTLDERIHCEGICAGCNRFKCPNRMIENFASGRLRMKMADMPLTYGFQQIFGKMH